MSEVLLIGAEDDEVTLADILEAINAVREAITELPANYFALVDRLDQDGYDFARVERLGPDEDPEPPDEEADL